MIVRVGTHTHSTTCVLSGLAMLAEVRAQPFVWAKPGAES